MLFREIFSTEEISPAEGKLNLRNTSIQLSGASKLAFIHVDNPSVLDGGSVSIIDSPLCNAKDKVMLLVTPFLCYAENTAPSYTPVGVFYDNVTFKWKLIRLDFSTIQTGSKYFIWS